jgi:hypothetical protein
MYTPSTGAWLPQVTVPETNDSGEPPSVFCGCDGASPLPLTEPGRRLADEMVTPGKVGPAATRRASAVPAKANHTRNGATKANRYLPVANPRSRAIRLCLRAGQRPRRPKHTVTSRVGANAGRPRSSPVLNSLVEIDSFPLEGFTLKVPSRRRRSRFQPDLVPAPGLAREPWNCAFQNEKMPPSVATNQ